MKEQILMASSGGFIFAIWIIGMVISGIVNSKKNKQIQKSYPKQPQQGMQPNMRRNPQQPNFQSQPNIQPQSKPYQKNLQPQQLQNMANNMNQGNIQNREYVSDEYVEEYVPDEHVEEYVPSDNFEVYVPEEMGEKGSVLPRDNFYSKMETIKALNDEEDVAREKAYQRKTENAFAEDIVKQPSRSKKIFSGQVSLKKAILISEVLGKPKAIEE